MNSKSKTKEPKYFVQRMDGNLLFSFLASEAEVVSVLKDFGPGMEKPFCPGVNAHGRINYFGYLWPDIHKQAKAIIRKLKTDKRFLNKIVSLWQRRVKGLKKFEKQIAQLSLRKLSDDQLVKIFRKLVNLYQAEYSPALLCDSFGLHTEQIITGKIKQYLAKVGQPREFARYLEILTSPAKQSWSNLEEIELLKIAQSKSKSSKQLVEQLKNHQQKYFWIENSYAKGISLKTPYFLRKIRRWQKEGMAGKKKIRELEQALRIYQQKKQRLLKQLKPDQELRQLIKWIGVFGYLHDARKGVMMEAHYYITLLLKEISRRLKLSLTELFYVDHHQIEKILKTKQVNRREIKQRIKLCVYLIWPKKYQILTGQQAKQWHRQLVGGKQQALRELKGVSASSGVIIGRAKIVRDIEDGWKIKPGDVLVTGMTRPHWMPFIKKSAGIVTDEGGITCHAAIVAREMGIPCIIATKVATKVIKDNNLIEVNTNHNTVRIIK